MHYYYPTLKAHLFLQGANIL